MRLAFSACLYRTIGNEVKMFSISRDVRIGVLILTGEGCHLWRGPIAVLVARDEDGPAREIWRHLEKIYLAAIGRESCVRFVVAGGDDARRKQGRLRQRSRRIVRRRLCRQRSAHEHDKQWCAVAQEIESCFCHSVDYTHLRTRYLRCATPGPAIVRIDSSFTLSASKLSKRRAPLPSKSGTMWISISSMRAAARYCWKTLAPPPSPTSLPLAAWLACLRADSMPSVTKKNVVPSCMDSGSRG